MTRLIRCRRTGGRRTEPRRCAAVRALAVALAATFAVLTIGGVSSFAPTGAVFAQTAGTAGQTLFNLFDGDSVDPKADGLARLAAAIRQAKAPRDCALGELTIYTPKGDPLFQGALSNARRDSLLRALEGQGLGVAGRLSVKEETGSVGKFDAGYIPPRDDKPPTLRTTSDPPKGSKVTAGRTIKVTMVARDDANRWQTGIKTIQLVADSEGGRFVASENYAPCAEPREKRVEATYEVPANPPPIVRLTALAEDHAGLMDTDVGEFPTGDWYGRFGWTHICQGGGSTDETHGIGDLTLDYDGRGNLTGMLVGSIPERKQTIPPCSFKHVAPGTFSAKLVGSYTPGPDTFSAQAVDVRTTPGRASWACPAGSSVQDQGFFTVYEGPMFRDAFRDLRRQPDGSRKSNGESTFSSGGGACTTNYSLTLRQAQN